jgi:hypothetical protein
MRNWPLEARRGTSGLEEAEPPTFFGGDLTQTCAMSDISNFIIIMIYVALAALDYAAVSWPPWI